MPENASALDLVLSGDPARGYGEHPWITWPRQAVVARLEQLLAEAAGAVR